MRTGLSLKVESQFYNGLPKMAAVCNSFADGVEVKHRKMAVNFSNIEHKPKQLIRSLCFDVDSENSLYQWHDNNCLEPNWIAINPENGHAHYGYLIKDPVSNGLKSRIKPIAFVDAIERGMTVKLGADLAYSGFMTKNPMHDKWDVLTGEENPYALNDLADNVPLVWKTKKDQAEDLSELGRNSTLFAQCRFWGYRNAERYKQTSNYESFYNAVKAVCDHHNMQFHSLLPESEVKNVAKSIAQYSFYKYKGDGKQRGIMDLVSKCHNLSMRDKQVLGARHSADTKRANTEQAIKETIAYLKTSGKKTNVSSIADYLSMNRSSLSRSYGAFIKVLL
jgi:hypothetical protein